MNSDECFIAEDTELADKGGVLVLGFVAVKRHHKSKQLFKNFLLILCEFHIIHPNPTHLSLLSCPPSTLATSPHQRKDPVKAVVCHSVSHSIDPLVYIPMLAFVHCVGLVRSLWLLPLY